MNRRKDLAAIAFTGKDAGAFLHNQLTEDVRALTPGMSTFAALCQPKGRVIALLMVGAGEDGYTVLCRASLADGLITHLTRFIFRDQVTIHRLEEAKVLSGLGHGPAGEPAASQDEETPLFEPLPGFRYTVSGNAATTSSDNEAAARDIEAERARELAHGIVWLDPETSEQFLPQMLGHEAIGALNFRKGCFPGQEVIARMRYLGKLKRHPWSGQLDRQLDLEPLGDAELLGGDHVAGAVLVEQRQRGDGAWQALFVARRPEAFEVNMVDMADGGHAARGQWLNEALDASSDEGPSAQGKT